MFPIATIVPVEKHGQTADIIFCKHNIFICLSNLFVKNGNFENEYFNRKTMKRHNTTENKRGRSLKCMYATALRSACCENVSTHQFMTGGGARGGGCACLRTHFREAKQGNTENRR